MLFQQQLRLPTDAEILPQSTVENNDGENIDFDETVEALLELRKTAFLKAQDNISKAQKQQKETYDWTHLKEELEVGTQVLLKNTAQKQRKSGKL